MKCGLKYRHRTQQIKNIKFILEDKLQEKEQYMAELFQFCIGNGKNYATILRTVYTLINEMSLVYNGSYHRVMNSLGVDQEKVKKLEVHWMKQDKGNGDELFLSNLKDWFKLYDNDHIVEIDY